MFVAYRRLRRCQPGHGHPVGRAGYVSEAGLVKEADTLGVAAMLSADAELQARICLSAKLAGRGDELADAIPVEGLERILLKDAFFEVFG